MIAVFEQVLTLFVFIAVGFALSRAGKINADHSKILSTLLVFVFSPCNSFSTFSKNFTKEYISVKYPIIIASAVLLLILALSMHFVAKLFSREKYQQSIYEYSLVLANYGYFGYALAGNLLGDGGLMDLMMFSLIPLVYTYTYGYCILTKSKISLKRLINPVSVAIVLGAVWGFFDLPLPNVVASIASAGSACMGTAAMLLAGVVISEFKLPLLLKRKRTYVLTALRLVIIPLIFGGILMMGGNLLGFGDSTTFRAVLTSVVLFISMPCGLNTIVFPRLVDESCETGASLALVSNVFACITVPVILTVFGIG